MKLGKNTATTAQESPPQVAEVAYPGDVVSPEVAAARAWIDGLRHVQLPPALVDGRLAYAAWRAGGRALAQKISTAEGEETRLATLVAADGGDVDDLATASSRVAALHRAQQAYPPPPRLPGDEMLALCARITGEVRDRLCHLADVVLPPPIDDQVATTIASIRTGCTLTEANATTATTWETAANVLTGLDADIGERLVPLEEQVRIFDDLLAGRPLNV